MVWQRLLGQSSVIKLINLPKSAIPNDVRRMLRTQLVENIERVSLEYHRFRPTGGAFVTLTTPSSLDSNLRLLRKGVTVSMIPVQSFVVHDAELSNYTPLNRTRGDVGKRGAADRGTITGDGPSGELGNGKSVVIWGLPDNLDPEMLQHYLKRYKAMFGRSVGEVTKLELRPRKDSRSSRHVVRCATTYDAHRLVRLLHMTYYNESVHGDKYHIGARVIY